MKKLAWLCFLSVLFSIYSCRNDIDPIPDAKSLKMEADRLLIEAMGYDVSEICEFEGGYLVNGFLWFTQEHFDFFQEIIRSDSTETGTRNIIEYSQKVKTEYQHKIKVIDNTGGDLTYSLTNAMNAWSNIGQCNIGIGFGTGTDAVKITVSVDEIKPNNVLDTKTLMVVKAPKDGKPSETILINKHCTFRPAQQSDQEKYMVMHALGHAIGFMHPSYEDYDRSSIMVKEKDPLTWSGFSKNDLFVFRSHYPGSSGIIPPVGGYGAKLQVVNNTRSDGFHTTLDDIIIKATLTEDPSYPLNPLEQYWHVNGDFEGSGSQNFRLQANTGINKIKYHAIGRAKNNATKSYDAETVIGWVYQVYPYIVAPANVGIGQRHNITIDYHARESNCQYIWELPEGVKLISQDGKVISVEFLTEGEFKIKAYAKDGKYTSKTNYASIKVHGLPTTEPKLAPITMENSSSAYARIVWDEEYKDKYNLEWIVPEEYLTYKLDNYDKFSVILTGRGRNTTCNISVKVTGKYVDYSKIVTARVVIESNSGDVDDGEVPFGKTRVTMDIRNLTQHPIRFSLSQPNLGVVVKPGLTNGTVADIDHGPRYFAFYVMSEDSSVDFYYEFSFPVKIGGDSGAMYVDIDGQGVRTFEFGDNDDDDYYIYWERGMPKSE